MSLNIVQVDLQRILQMGIMSNKACNFLQSCFDMGGYVAGGFARSFSAAYLGVEGNFQSVASYINNKEFKSIHPIQIRKSGDVDIFFSNSENAEACIQKVKSNFNPTWDSKTLGGWGHEFLIGTTKFQLISKSCLPPHEMMSTFDITNAKIFIENDKITFSDEWIDLEKSKTIGIDDYTKHSLLWRINKWSTRHGYKEIRKGDSEKIIENVVDLIELAKTESLKRFEDKVTPNTVLNQVYSLIHRLKMDPTDVLVASSLFDSYKQISIMKLISNNNSQ